MTLALLGCGTLTFLPRPYETHATNLKTPQELARAYSKVLPGETRASELSTIGFDRNASNVQILSYLGVIERFAGDSRGFDRLDPALQTCIEARDRCTALVYSTAGKPGQSILSSFGFGAANAASRDAEVTLLVQDGRVAYKAISGVQPAMVASEEPVIRRVTVTPAAVRVDY